jgi:MoaA/NifB/PqqE/SkfB family radical SAM enzyme
MCEVRKIDWQIPEKIIQEVASLFPYLQEIIWQGGEVFLVDYFRELLKQAGPYPNLVHEITTNGHLINEEWLDILNKINLNLNISIDGVTRQTYEYIRKGSRFEDLIKTLGFLNQAKDRGEGKSLVLVMIVTVMRSNYYELEKIVDFARRYNFDRVVLQPIKGNYDNDENIFFYNDIKILRYIEELKPSIRKEAEDAGIKLVEWLPTFFGTKRSFPCGSDNGDKGKRESQRRLVCYAPWQQMFVEWGGGVYPHCLCIQDGPGNEPKKVGNVLRESLSEIWNGEKMQRFRRKILDGDFLELCNPDCLNGLISSDCRDIPIKL